MSTLSDISIPDIPPLSPGSSVSTRLQDEYDELLKFAVVVPKYDPRGASRGQTLTDFRESFPQRDVSSGSLDLPGRGVAQTRDDDECSEATDVTPINPSASQDGLPDFGGHSPIRQNLDNLVRQNPDNPSRLNLENLIRQIPDNTGRGSQNPSGSSRGSRNPAVSWVAENQNQNGLSPRDFHSYNNSGASREVEIEQGEYERVYTATVDPDVAKMETMMDQWCLDLKRNVLAEFSQSKIKIVEQGRQQLIREQEKHASEKIKLMEEMNSLKELLATYEKSIERKDQVISNLSSAMQKQRDKMDMMRKFCDWKIKHNDYKREAFCSKLAKQHHERRLAQKAWDAWHSIIEARWRQRVEKACQAKSQEVCLQLTSEYEAKLREAHEALNQAKGNVANMEKERERYEEMMKKAFMRGVCALNLEAMTIFHGDEKENQADNDNRIPDASDSNLMSSMPDKDYGGGKSLPSDPMMGVSIQRHERIVTSEGSRSGGVTQTKPQNSQPKPTKKVLTTKVSAKVDSGKGGGKLGQVNALAPPMSSVIVERHQPVSKPTKKVLTTKVSAKVDSGKGGGKLGQVNALAPPMSSVIVERHQPVSKQTMPHAIAEQYPRPSSSSGQRGKPCPMP